MWSQLLVSATFLEVLSRFQPRQPLELPDQWLSQARVEELQGEQGGTPPDGFLGSLVDQHSDSGQSSPSYTHWRGGPIHQEQPWDKVRP